MKALVENSPSERELKVISAQAAEEWLLKYVAALTGLSTQEIDRTKPFSWYGLDSIRLVEMAADLEDWLARPLSATLAWEYSAIDSLSDYLSRCTQEKPDEPDALDAVFAEIEQES